MLLPFCSISSQDDKLYRTKPSANDSFLLFSKGRYECNHGSITNQQPGHLGHPGTLLVVLS